MPDHSARKIGNTIVLSLSLVVQIIQLCNVPATSTERFLPIFPAPGLHSDLATGKIFDLDGSRVCASQRLDIRSSRIGHLDSAFLTGDSPDERLCSRERRATSEDDAQCSALDDMA